MMMMMGEESNGAAGANLKHPECLEFQERLSKLGLSKARFAELAGAARSAVYRWTDKTVPPEIAHRFLWILESFPEVKTVLENAYPPSSSIADKLIWVMERRPEIQESLAARFPEVLGDAVVVMTAGVIEKIFQVLDDFPEIRDEYDLKQPPPRGRRRKSVGKKGKKK